VAVLALAAPAFAAERLTARSPEAAKRAFWAAFGRPGALPASSAEMTDIQVPASDFGFDVQGNLPNQELELTTLVIGPPTVINHGTADFDISSPNVVGALEWTNVLIPSTATAGDAVLVVRLTGGSNTDTWIQYLKLN
jgi:hypothetical protein